MSIKKIIEGIYDNNTDYSRPGQAVNQASSLNALSGDLYADSKRFIYELLQNADDSALNGERIKVWLKTFDEKLVIAHSGNQFTYRDIHGICNINNGTKKSDITKTGYKGIGFKSVFGQSDRVTIFTNGEYFRFDSSYPFTWKWEDTQKVWEEKNDREFQYPWQIVPIYTEVQEIPKKVNDYLQSLGANVATVIEMKSVEETIEAAKNLSENLNMFLFLKNISEINFDLEELTKIEIDLLDNNQIHLRNGEALKTDWLLNTTRLNIPEKLKRELQNESNIPDKLLNTDYIDMTLAAKLDGEGIKKLSQDEKLLYSYLPTNESKYALPVLVNTNFLTTSNRESIHTNSRWNQWIFKMIAIEIYKWISDLVKSDFKFQAYKLIPDHINHTNPLAKEYNKGIECAHRNIPFVMSKNDELIKITETILDFTHLSTKEFVGEDPIINFITDTKSITKDIDKKIAKNTLYLNELKKLNPDNFQWKDLKSFLTSVHFIEVHKVSDNIELIKHFKELCHSREKNVISTDLLMNIPFIYDHKNFIKYPSQMSFPSADDNNWNNQDSQISFLHPHILEWLQKDIESRHWVESLGVIEKTDITYIYQNILPKIESYITLQNGVQTLRDLFSLYKKDDLPKGLINNLSRLKLITIEGSMHPAEECYLSSYYKPSLDIEGKLDYVYYVDMSYCEDINEIEEWRTFFKLLGVQDGIKSNEFLTRVSTTELIDLGMSKDYFETEDKIFTPYITSFKSEQFTNIVTLNHISKTIENPEFSAEFWRYYIERNTPNKLEKNATAYWGRFGKSGQNVGDEILNYVPWFIKKFQCIPTLSSGTKVAPDTLLNTEEITRLAGNYLPIFDGPELSSDWKVFFKFRTKLELEDYLKILEDISTDINKEKEVKRSNYQRIQDIYEILLDQCIYWSTAEITLVEEWSHTGSLLNSKSTFSNCIDLKCFLDNSEAIFQDEYSFIKLSSKNRRNPNLERLLGYFNVKLLKEEEFDLIYDDIELCGDLKTRLYNVIPYLILWVDNEEGIEYEVSNLAELRNKVATLEIYEAEKLQITYKDLGFSKIVNTHFNDRTLYVTKPWYSNDVLLRLSDILCDYLNLLGHDRKLDFLLRSGNDVINKYFFQENIANSEILDDITNNEDQNSNTFKEIESAVDKGIPSEYFHLSSKDYEALKYIQKLIPRAVKNVMAYLEKLSEYDCTNSYMIADSVIGGISKNGNDITIVARPSDNNQVLLYYTSEFDVLDYVDAEFWYEDGIHYPKQITLGQILKETNINRIPISNLVIEDEEMEEVLKESTSEILEFNPVPYTPEKTAKIISSFANMKGGKIIFGIKENPQSSNELIDLSVDFKAVEITKKAVSLLSPTPKTSYGWVNHDGKLLFIIEVIQDEEEIYFNSEKFIRKGTESILEESITKHPVSLSVPEINNNIAIIIGLETYAPREDNRITNVKYANNDVKKFKELLISTMNINEKDIYIYSNEEALKSDLEYGMLSLFHSLTENDRLIFYYVGHGFHNGMTNYLSTYDMHPSNISATAISLNTILLDPLKESKCNNALIFIDACAQTFIDESGRSQINNISQEEFMLLKNDFPNYSTFLSCQPGQSSYSSDTLCNGIWTHHLVEALSGNIAQAKYNNRYITDRLLRDYLSRSVSAYTLEEHGYKQYPTAILDTSHENIIIDTQNLRE